MMFGSMGSKSLRKNQTKTFKWSIPFMLNKGNDMFGFIKNWFRANKLNKRLISLIKGLISLRQKSTKWLKGRNS